MKEKEQREFDNSLKLLVKTSGIVLIGVFISKILAYSFRIIIARYYGPETYGLFTLALTITSLFLIIASLGLSEGLLRYIPIYKSKKKFAEINYLIKRILKIYLLTGFLSSIFLWNFSEYISVNVFHDPNLILPLKIFTAMSIIALFNSVFLVSLRAFEEISAYSLIFNIIQNISRFLIIVLMIFIGFRSGASPIVWSFVLSMLVCLIVSYWFFAKKIKPLISKPKKKINPAIFSKFFSYSWPILFYSLISLVFYWIDTFSLGYYKSAVEVGFYQAAVPIAMFLGIVPEILMQLFFPMINRCYGTKNYKLIEPLSKQVAKWIFMVLLPIFILIFSFPGAALNILFGSQYLVAENVLRILLIGSFISSIFVVSNNLISMIGKSKMIFFNISIAAICNFILNTIMVPMNNIFGLDNSNGMMGAALATLISMFLLNTLFVIQTKRYLHFIPARRNMINIALLSIIPILLLFYLKTLVSINFVSIVLLAGFFILFYLGMLLIFKFLDENDWMIIKAVWRKLRRV